MIGKVAGTGKGFGGLLAYLMRGRREAPDPGRVAWAETRNLLFDDPVKAMRMMRRTANMSARCAKPVYHFSISWREDELVSDEDQRAVARDVLKDLGLDEHQAILLGHRDTAHRHVHVLVNRVHPETLTAWRTSHDFRRLEQAVGRIALAKSMLYVPGRFNEPVRYRHEARRARDAERQRAVRLGMSPNLTGRWTREQIATRRERLVADVQDARSWSDLAARLAAQGLAMSAKGSGLVIGDTSGTMKLSDLRKDIRLATLEERFGSFAGYQQARALQPVPVATQTLAAPLASAAPVPDASPPRGAAADRHRNAGPALDEAQALATVRQTLAKARSWDDVDRALTAQELRLRSDAGQIVVEGKGGTLTASHLGADGFLERLEERYQETLAAFDARRAEDERLAQMGREERLAVLAARRRGTGVPPAEEGSDTADATARSIKRSAPPHDPHADYLAGRAYGAAGDAADLTYRLYRAGLATRAQLKRALADRDRAKAAWVQTLSADEQLALMLRDKLARRARTAKRKPVKRHDRDREPER